MDLLDQAYKFRPKSKSESEANKIFAKNSEATRNVEKSEK